MTGDDVEAWVASWEPQAALAPTFSLEFGVLLSSMASSGMTHHFLFCFESCGRLSNGKNQEHDRY